MSSWGEYIDYERGDEDSDPVLGNFVAGNVCSRKRLVTGNVL